MTAKPSLLTRNTINKGRLEVRTLSLNLVTLGAEYVMYAK